MMLRKLLWIVYLFCEAIAVELAKGGLAVLISVLVTVPLVILIMLLAAPYFVEGPDSLVWVVTGVMVLVALPVVYWIGRLQARLFGGFTSNSEEENEHPSDLESDADC